MPANPRTIQNAPLIHLIGESFHPSKANGLNFPWHGFPYRSILGAHGKLPHEINSASSCVAHSSHVVAGCIRFRR